MVDVEESSTGNLSKGWGWFLVGCGEGDGRWESSVGLGGGGFLGLINVCFSMMGLVWVIEDLRKGSGIRW